jgi:hypothetical protein
MPGGWPVTIPVGGPIIEASLSTGHFPSRINQDIKKTVWPADKRAHRWRPPSTNESAEPASNPRKPCECSHFSPSS